MCIHISNYKNIMLDLALLINIFYCLLYLKTRSPPFLFFSNLIIINIYNPCFFFAPLWWRSKLCNINYQAVKMANQICSFSIIMLFKMFFLIITRTWLSFLLYTVDGQYKLNSTYERFLFSKNDFWIQTTPIFKLKPVSSTKIVDLYLFL